MYYPIFDWFIRNASIIILIYDYLGTKFWRSNETKFHLIKSDFFPYLTQKKNQQSISSVCDRESSSLINKECEVPRIVSQLSSKRSFWWDFFFQIKIIAQIFGFIRIEIQFSESKIAMHSIRLDRFRNVPIIDCLHKLIVPLMFVSIAINYFSILT